MLEVVVAIASGVASGLVVGCLALAIRYLYLRLSRNAGQTIQLRSQDGPAQESGDDSALEVDRITQSDRAARPHRHQLEGTISLEDRVALARFVVTVCGYGPYGGSARMLEHDCLPRMNHLRQRTGKLLRKVSGLQDPAQISNQDAERIFEELAHTSDFLELCGTLSLVIQTTLNDGYRPLATACQQQPDVIPPGILPSDEAIKLLIG